MLTPELWVLPASGPPSPSWTRWERAGRRPTSASVDELEERVLEDQPRVQVGLVGEGGAGFLDGPHGSGRGGGVAVRVDVEIDPGGGITAGGGEHAVAQ